VAGGWGRAGGGRQVGFDLARVFAGRPLLARLAGDEFTLFFPEVTGEPEFANARLAR